MAHQERSKQEPLEKSLFRAADKLRKGMSAAYYKNIVLGLVFLKYVSDQFDKRSDEIREEYFDTESEWYEPDPKRREEIIAADLKDRDSYLERNILFVPSEAHWKFLHSRAMQSSIGLDIDRAMDALEKENPSLKGVLNKTYASPNLDTRSLGGIVNLISDIDMRSESEKSKDLLGRIYEYFLGEFASLEGKKGGQFYTPKSIVRLMVEMIEPYHGRIYDPCCGSGGMFIMSEKFIESHKGNIDCVNIYGQETNDETWRLCRMNLALHNMDSSQVKWNTEGSFLRDAHPDLKADYILANPPFNDSDWSGDLLRNDPRWQYGVPPAGNANFAWLQHMIYHLSPKGILACVLANGSLSSQSGGEGAIRRSLVEHDLVDCIVALPKQLFYNTGIPACIWFLSRKRMGNGDRKRTGEVLFIDASGLGRMEDRTHRVFDDEDIRKITDTYREWRSKENAYEDVKGFCKSAKTEELEKHGFVLTPGRYVGIPDEADDGVPFEEKISALTATLKGQMEKEKALNDEIEKQLGKVGFKI